MKNSLTKYLSEFSSLKLTRPISDKIRILEICAVVLTGIGKFVFMDYLNWRLPFVVISILAWSAYVIYRYKKDKYVLKDWGFLWDNFKSAIKQMLPFAIISIVLFFIVYKILIFELTNTSEITFYGVIEINKWILRK